MTQPGARTIRLTVDAGGERIDLFLSNRLTELTRSRIKGLIAAGMVTIDQSPAKASAKVRPGQAIELILPPPEPLDLTPERLHLDPVYEDEHMIVVNKPAGMVVHPAPGHSTGTLVHGLLHHCPDLTGVGGTARPGIVHRLDKDTSGLIAVAKTDPAHQALVTAFKERRIDKTYLAVLVGRADWPTKLVDAPIGRHPVKRKRMAVVQSGRAAKSLFRVKQALIGPLTAAEVDLFTGRTHQIRVHAAHLHLPILGDPVYGSRNREKNLDPRAKQAAAGVDRQLLHAWRLTLNHPITGAPLSLEAPPPSDMIRLIEALTPSPEGTGP